MHPPDDADLLALFRAIAVQDLREVTRLIEACDGRIAPLAIQIGASRQDSTTYFLDAIQHYVYAGDTAMHIAAAAYQVSAATMLIANEAQVRARNRRGAEPLHYAADGNPAGPRWNPDAQRDVIAYLVARGADPNARDRSGVAPLHRAVRTRCTAAVRALLDAGADLKCTNGNGSTPLHLAVQNTGRGESGGPVAREQQAAIVHILLQRGARSTDSDMHGKSVQAAAASAWIRELLA